MKKQQIFKKMAACFMIMLAVQACKKESPEELIKLENEGLISVHKGNVTATPYVANGRGVTDGPISVAQFESPSSMAATKKGDLYIVDLGIDFPSRIRMISSGGIVSTILGNSDPDNRYFPWAIDVSQDGTAYFTNFGDGNYQIMSISENGVIDTIAGNGRGFTDGPAHSAQFDSPLAIAVGKDGAIYVSDTGNQAIRKIQDGVVSTVATGLFATQSINVATNGTIYTNAFADEGAGSNTILKISPAGNITTLVDEDAGLPRSDDIEVLPSGKLLISTPEGNILEISSKGEVRTLVTVGGDPFGLAIVKKKLFIAQRLTSAILQVDLKE